MWFNEFLEDLSFSDVTFVNTEPHICHKRIHKRDRSGEDIIKLEYLERCHQYHLDWIFNNTSDHIINKLELNGNIEFAEDENVLNEYIKEIQKFIF